MVPKKHTLILKYKEVTWYNEYFTEKICTIRKPLDQTSTPQDDVPAQQDRCAQQELCVLTQIDCCAQQELCVLTQQDRCAQQELCVFIAAHEDEIRKLIKASPCKSCDLFD